jgi:hypothetical protein
MPIVLRIAETSFAEPIARHFRLCCWCRLRRLGKARSRSAAAERFLQRS